MSEFSDVCDAFVDDLTTTVARDATAHRYATWDPEKFQNDGSKHVAVWPAGEAELAEAFTTHGRLLRQTYVIAYWEPGDDEDERQVADEEAAKDLLDLHEAMRARFFDLSLQPTGTQMAYEGTAFRDSTSPVRGFVMTVRVDRGKDLL